MSCDILGVHLEKVPVTKSKHVFEIRHSSSSSKVWNTFLSHNRPQIKKQTSLGNLQYLWMLQPGNASCIEPRPALEKKMSEMKELVSFNTSIINNAGHLNT